MRAFEWLEDKKFNAIAEDCPWRKLGTDYCKVMDKSGKDTLCRKHFCAMWYFIKKLTE